MSQCLTNRSYARVLVTFSSCATMDTPTSVPEVNIPIVRVKLYETFHRVHFGAINEACSFFQHSS